MVQPVQLQTSIFLFFLGVLCGCDAPKEKVITASKFVNADTSILTNVNGLLMDKNEPFSGTLFALFPETKDTAYLASYLDGKEHGEWKKFYTNHQLKEKRYFENGQKTGEFIAWWENGQKQLAYTFADDEYQGTCKEWNTEGRLVRIMNYDKGYEEGVQQWWYNNGKIKANYVIKGGRRYGLLGTKNCVNVTDSIF